MLSHEDIAKRDLRPVVECQRQDYGMSIASRRVAGSAWRENARPHMTARLGADFGYAL